MRQSPDAQELFRPVTWPTLGARGESDGIVADRDGQVNARRVDVFALAMESVVRRSRHASSAPHDGQRHDATRSLDIELQRSLIVESVAFDA